tara:strand:- start:65 stop:931 length:867 start_codon:yes stop_codon:yes gene_type:complete
MDLKDVWKPTTLVLSSGGICGILLLGSVKLLKERELLTDVKHYIGCSAGSIVIGALVLGFSAEKMMELLLQLDFSDWNNELTATEGLIKAKKLTNVIHEYLGEFCLKDFNERITFSVVNLNLGITEYIDSVTHPDLKLADAVMMSCSLPILFPAIKYNGYLYCDGGVADPFPINKSEEPENTLGLNCIKSTTGNYVEIKKSFSYILTVANILVNVIRDELNVLKNYKHHNVIELFSCYEEELKGTLNCPNNKKVFMYHEGIKLTTSFIKIFSERKFMELEDPQRTKGL